MAAQGHCAGRIAAGAAEEHDRGSRRPARSVSKRVRRRHASAASAPSSFGFAAEGCRWRWWHANRLGARETCRHRSLGPCRGGRRREPGEVDALFAVVRRVNPGHPRQQRAHHVQGLRGQAEAEPAGPQPRSSARRCLMTERPSSTSPDSWCTSWVRRTHHEGLPPRAARPELSPGHPVNALRPGWIGSATASTGVYRPPRAHTAGQAGEVGRVTAAILLCSDEGAITGQVLGIDAARRWP
jgi:hypothetical protein